MEERRFRGKINEEYELSRLAWTNYDKFQNTVGKILKRNFEKNSAKEINTLEIGCGSGLTTKIILESDKRIRLVAIDNEPEMLELSERNLAGYLKSGRLKIIEADALSFLMNVPEKYDVVASAFTLHNFTSLYRKKVLKGIFHALKPGGIFINADKCAIDDEAEHKKAFKYQLDMFEKTFSQIKRPDLAFAWIKHNLEDDKPLRKMRQKDYIALARKIGFKKTKVIFRKRMEAVLVSEKA